MEEIFEAYHQRIEELWAADHGCPLEGFDRVPYMGYLPENPPEKVKALILGMNPSFSVNALAGHWEAINHNHPLLALLPITNLLAWPLPQDAFAREATRNAVIHLDRHSRLHYAPYFAPIESLARAAGLDATEWLHMDFFPIRETSQRLLEAELRYPKRSEVERFENAMPDSPYRLARTWHSALESIFGATLQLISSLKPSIVVVLNSWASKMLEYKLGLEVEANGHRYRTARVPGASWLLSSQLSGGATSVYGAQRLLADLRDAVLGGPGLSGGAQTDAERAAEAAIRKAADDAEKE